MGYCVVEKYGAVFKISDVQTIFRTQSSVLKIILQNITCDNVIVISIFPSPYIEKKGREKEQLKS